MNDLSSADIFSKLVAGLLDAFGLGCLFLSLTGESDIGNTLSFIPDILGLGILGIPNLMKATKSKKRFFGVSALGEFIPFLGDILPLWSVFAWFKKDK